MCLYAAYSPQENSVRQIDLIAFYSTLPYHVSLYNNEGILCLLCDFNARIGDIDRVDKIHQGIIDTSENAYHTRYPKTTNAERHNKH